MNKTFFIKITTKKKQIYWVIDADNKDGFLLAPDICTALKRFNKYDEAERFIVKKKFKKDGLRAYILSNEDLIIYEKNNPNITAAVGITLYYIRDKFGRKVCFNAANDTYTFENVDTGFCVWQSQADCSDLVEHCKSVSEGIEVVPISNLK